MVYDPVKLEPIQGATFSSMMKPDIPEEEWATADEKWHEALNVNKKTIPEIKAAPSEAEVWKAFVAFVSKYNREGSQYTAPISAGQNIDRFDLIIADRLNEKHKVKKYKGKPLLFNTNTSIDLKNFLFAWFEGNDELKNYSMNTLRPYLGISEEGSHDALTDVVHTGEIIMRFIKLHRKLFPSIPFKGSMINSKYGVSPE